MTEKNCQALLADDSVAADTADTDDDECCDDITDMAPDVQPEAIATPAEVTKVADTIAPTGVKWREPRDSATPVVDEPTQGGDGNGGKPGNGGRNANRQRRGGRGRRTSNNNGGKRPSGNGSPNPKSNDQKKPE